MRSPVPFGKYLLLDRISVGGMAEVFKAKSYGVEGFEKIIAIKRILPTMGEDRDFIKMFIDEAKIAGQLAHANICQIFELGRIDGSHFIAMEYIWGKDLLQIQNRLRKIKQPMPVPMACFAIGKVLEGLDYAHRKRDPLGRPLEIVHRDCSPQNVLVSYEGEVKVIDFGIAKATSRNSRTMAGVLKGKFGYMSPEQVRGLPLDRRSDIFALGTMLFECLTGERLFQGETDFSTLEKVRNVDIRNPRELNPDIPEAIEKIILKALAKDVDERYQWCSEMHTDLQAYLMSQDILFTPKSLSGWLKEVFSTEIERERAQLEQYKRVGRDGLIQGLPAAEAKLDVVENLGEAGPVEGDATQLGLPDFEDVIAAAAAAAAAGGAAATPEAGPASGSPAATGSRGDDEDGGSDFGEEAPTEIFGEIDHGAKPATPAAPAPAPAAAPASKPPKPPPGRPGATQQPAFAAAAGPGPASAPMAQPPAYPQPMPPQSYPSGPTTPPPFGALDGAPPPYNPPHNGSGPIQHTPQPMPAQLQPNGLAHEPQPGRTLMGQGASPWYGGGQPPQPPQQQQANQYPSNPSMQHPAQQAPNQYPSNPSMQHPAQQAPNQYPSHPSMQHPAQQPPMYGSQPDMGGYQPAMSSPQYGAPPQGMQSGPVPGMYGPPPQQPAWNQQPNPYGMPPVGALEGPQPPMADGPKKKSSIARDVLIGVAIAAVVLGGFLAFKFLVMDDDDEAEAPPSTISTIKVSLDAGGSAELFVDGERKAAVADGAQIPVSPGKRKVKLVGAKGAKCEQDVDLAAGKTTTVQCKLGAGATPPPAAPPTAPPAPPTAPIEKPAAAGSGTGSAAAGSATPQIATPADKPADKPIEKPADKPAQPVEKPADKPIDKPADKPVTTAVKPADKPTTTTKPADKPTTTTKPVTTTKPADKPTTTTKPVTTTKPTKPAETTAASAKGYLQVYSKPSAKISVDGADTGMSTPITGTKLSLAPGKHKITFTLGGDKHTFSVTIKAGETTTLSKDLQ